MIRRYEIRFFLHKSYFAHYIIYLCLTVYTIATAAGEMVAETSRAPHVLSLSNRLTKFFQATNINHYLVIFNCHCLGQDHSK